MRELLPRDGITQSLQEGWFPSDWRRLDNSSCVLVVPRSPVTTPPSKCAWVYGVWCIDPLPRGGTMFFFPSSPSFFWSVSHDSAKFFICLLYSSPFWIWEFLPLSMDKIIDNVTKMINDCYCHFYTFIPSHASLRHCCFTHHTSLLLSAGLHSKITQWNALKTWTSQRLASYDAMLCDLCVKRARIRLTSVRLVLVSKWTPASLMRHDFNQGNLIS